MSGSAAIHRPSSRRRSPGRERVVPASGGYTATRAEQQQPALRRPRPATTKPATAQRLRFRLNLSSSGVVALYHWVLTASPLIHGRGTPKRRRQGQRPGSRAMLTMPNSDPSPETRFQKGRAKTGGRQKGTKDKIPVAAAPPNRARRKVQTLSTRKIIGAPGSRADASAEILPRLR